MLFRFIFAIFLLFSFFLSPASSAQYCASTIESGSQYLNCPTGERILTLTGYVGGDSNYITCDSTGASAQQCSWTRCINAGNCTVSAKVSDASSCSGSPPASPQIWIWVYTCGTNSPTSLASPRNQWVYLKEGEYVYVSDSTGSLKPTSSGFSIALWIGIDSTSMNFPAGIFGRSDAAWGLAIDTDKSVLVYLGQAVWDTNYVLFQQSVSHYELLPNVYHLALVYDHAGATLSFYVNSILMASRAVTALTLPLGDSTIVIAEKFTSYVGSGFNGYLDNVAIWDQTITQSTMVAHMTSQSMTPTPSNIWAFDGSLTGSNVNGNLAYAGTSGISYSVSFLYLFFDLDSSFSSQTLTLAASDADDPDASLTRYITSLARPNINPTNLLLDSLSATVTVGTGLPTGTVTYRYVNPLATYNSADCPFDFVNYYIAAPGGYQVTPTTAFYVASSRKYNYCTASASAFSVNVPEDSSSTAITLRPFDYDYNYAMRFGDPDTTNNGYLDVALSSAFSQTSFTFEFWFSPGITLPTTGFNTYVLLETCSASFKVQIANTGILIATLGASNLTTTSLTFHHDRWYHFHFHYNNGGSVSALYINGNSIGTFNGARTLSFSSLRLGGSCTSPGPAYGLKIHDLRITNSGSNPSGYPTCGIAPASSPSITIPISEGAGSPVVYPSGTSTPSGSYFWRRRNEPTCVIPSLTAKINTLPTKGNLYQTADGITKGTLIASGDLVTDALYRVIYDSTVLDYSSTDTFTYSAADQSGSYSSPVTVTITLTPTVDPPVSSDVWVSTLEDTSVQITLSVTDLDGFPVSAVVAELPSRGALYADSGLNTQITAAMLPYTVSSPYRVWFQPSPNENGILYAIFPFYALGSTNLTSGWSLVYINVTSVIDPPVCTSASFTLETSATHLFSLQGTSIEGQPLSYILTSLPGVGTLDYYLTSTAATLTSYSDPRFVYTAPSSSGSTSFTFKVNDVSDSSPCTISITIVPFDNPPVAFNNTYSGIEDTPDSTFCPFIGNDPDLLDTITWRLGVIPGTLQNSSGYFYSTGDIVSCDLLYTPPPNANVALDGKLQMTYQAFDGFKYSDWAYVLISLIAVPDDCTTANQTVTLYEDTIAYFTLIYNSVDNFAPTNSYSDGPAHGIVDYVNSAVSELDLWYRPDSNYNGGDGLVYCFPNSVNVESCCGGVTFVVLPVFDPPVASPYTFTGNTSSPLVMTFYSASQSFFLISSADSANMQIVIETLPSNGVLSFNNAPTYTPITYAPFQVPISTPSDIQLSFMADWFPGPTHRFITFSYYALDVTQQPPARGPSATITLDVTPDYAVPIPISQYDLQTNEDTPLIIILAATQPGGYGSITNITVDVTGMTGYLSQDACANPLSVYTLDGPTANVSYCPPANQHSPPYPFDQFTFQASNSQFTSVIPGVVTIIVFSQGDNPQANPVFVTTTEHVMTPIDLSGTSPDFSDPFVLKINIVTFPAGQLFLDEAGTTPLVSNTPYPLRIYFKTDSFPSCPITNNCVDFTTFRYRVVDPNGAVSPDAIVNISVTAVNDPPVGYSYTYTGNENALLPISLSYTDPDAHNFLLFSTTVNTIPSGGTLYDGSMNVINTPGQNVTGTLLYFQPTLYQFGSPYASFTFTIVDDEGLTALIPATATINILELNFPPTPYNQTVQVSEGSSAVIFLNGTDDHTFLLDCVGLITTFPTHGLLYQMNGTQITSLAPTVFYGLTVVYVPSTYYTGADSFRFTLTDEGSLTSSPGIITLDVVHSNHAPVASDSSASEYEDTPLASASPICPNYTNPYDPLDTNSVFLSYWPTDLGDFYTDPLDVNSNVTFAPGPVLLPSLCFYFVPKPNYYGTFTVKFFVTDSSSVASNDAYIDITIIDTPDLPVLNDFAVSTPEDQSLPIALQVQYIDSSNLLQPNQIVNAPSNGVLYWSSDGFTPLFPVTVLDPQYYSTVIYYPDLYYIGPDSFTYQTTANSNFGTVSITVIAEPDPPIAYGASYFLQQSVTLTQDIYLYGSDIDSTSLTACISQMLFDPVGSDTNIGTLYQLDNSYVQGAAITQVSTECVNVTNNNNTIQYVAPVRPYPKTVYPFVAFKFRLFDSAGQFSQEALVRIFIEGNNNPPFAYAQNLTLYEDVRYTWVPNVTDPDSTHAPIIYIETIPGNNSGILYQNIIGDVPGAPINPGDAVTARVIYIPPTNQNNFADFWTFRACDFQNTSLCSPSTRVDFYVLPVNDPPAVTNFSTTVTANRTVTFSLRGYAIDVENDPITFYVTSLPTSGKVFDMVTPAGIELIPCGNASANCTTLPYLIQSPNATLKFQPVDATVVSSPYATVGWQAYDGQNFSLPASVSIDLVRNLPPTATPGSAYMLEDTPANITLAGVDPDNDPMTPYITVYPLRGTLYQWDGTKIDPTTTSPWLVTDPLFRLVFIPVLNDASSYDSTNSSIITPYTTFTFIMTDPDQYSSNPAQITAYVWPVQDPPSAENITISMREEDTKTITLDGSDPENDPLSFLLLSVPSQGSVFSTLNGINPLDPNNPLTNASLPFYVTGTLFAQLIYDSPRVDGNNSLVEYMTYVVQVLDSNKTVLQQSQITYVTIIVIPNNDPPIANDVDAFMIEDSNVTIYLSGWDPDVGDTISPVIVDLPPYGSLYQWPTNPNFTSVADLDRIVTPYTDVTDTRGGTAANSTWRLIYVPPANANGMPFTQFTYLLTDGRADSTPGRVTIYVTAVNDPPLANVPRSQRAYLDSDLVIYIGGSDVETDSSTPLRGFIVQQDQSFNSTGSSLYQYKDNGLGREKLNFTVQVTRGPEITEPCTELTDAQRRVILSPNLLDPSKDRDQVAFSVQFFDGLLWSKVETISVLVQRPKTELPSGYTSTTGTWAGPLIGAAAAVVALLIIIGIIWYRNTRVGDADDYIKMFEDLDEPENVGNDDDDGEANPRTPLEMLLLDEKYQVVNALLRAVDVAEYDNLAKALVDITEYHGCTLQMLKYFITIEVQSATSAGTLFRANSIASKMMTAYTKMIGNEYLRVTLKSPIETIIKKDHAMEVDPKKLKSGENRKNNMRLLQLACQRFLDWIVSSTSNAPLPFKVLSNHLFYTVEKKFPASKHTAVGGFLFLRFFCPAIISPEGFKVIDSPPSSTARRALVLIAKALQNLANGIEFGKKEEYMIGLNDFIKRNMEPLKTYFDSMVAIPSQLGKVPPHEVSLEKETASLTTIHRYLYDNKQRIIDILEGRDDQSERSDSHSTSRSGRSRTSKKGASSKGSSKGESRGSSKGSSRGESRGSSRGESHGSSKEGSSKGSRISRASSKGSRLNRSRSDSSLHQKPFGEEDDEATEMSGEDNSFDAQSDPDRPSGGFLPIDPHQIFIGENGTEYVITEGEELSDNDPILDDLDMNPFTLEEVGTETLRAEGGNVDWTEVGSSFEEDFDRPVVVQETHEGFNQNGEVIDPVLAFNSVMDRLGEPQDQ